jgi:hypothetical protein
LLEDAAVAVACGEAEYEAVVVTLGLEGGYEKLCREIGRFFKTRKVPVQPEEIIEIFAFMEVADESKRQGDVPVSLVSVLAKARVDAAAKLAK